MSTRLAVVVRPESLSHVPFEDLVGPIDRVLTDLFDGLD